VLLPLVDVRNIDAQVLSKVAIAPTFRSLVVEDGPYRSADANLDGFVDVSDFNVWNINKFTNNAAHSQGDFNADGIVDVSDWNLWNSQRFKK